MKIVHIITSLSIGGAEKLLVNVANRQSVNHEVTIIYFKVHTLKNHFNKNVAVIHVPLNKNIVKELKLRLYNIQPNIVHTHLSHADLFGLLAARKMKDVKLFTTIHNTKYRFNLFDYGYYFMYRILFDYVAPKTKIIAISKSVQKVLTTKVGILKERITLLYNTVSESNASEMSNKDDGIVTDKAFKILFIGRLSLQKSVHTLLEAVGNLPNEIRAHVKVYIVGKGDLRDELVALTKELHIEQQVLFEGEKDEVGVYYKNADVFVLPSIFEGLGIVVLEAFKYGIPVIASNIEGPMELIDHGKTGLLFNVGDAKDLASNIELLYTDRVLANALSTNALEVYNASFSPEVYLKKLEHIYLGS